MGKTKLIELDVDFIGGQGSLTKDEEIAITNYIRKSKAQHAKKHPGKQKLRTSTVRKKAGAYKTEQAVSFSAEPAVKYKRKK